MKKIYLALCVLLMCIQVPAQVYTDYSLPVSISNFNMVETNKTIEINFTTITESNLERHEIQRSMNGIEFRSIGTIGAKNMVAGYDYYFTDATPMSGNNYYRIVSYAKDGGIYYSNIRKIALGKERTEILILPNPVTNGRMNLQLMNFNKGQYSIDLYNSAGMKVYSRSVQHMGGTLSQSFNLPDSLTRGIYTLNVISETQTFNKTIQIIR